MQRWLLGESQGWALHAVEHPSFAVAYAHTSTILFGLQEQLSHVERVGGLDDLFADEGDDV